MICPHCNKPMDSGADKCRFCGATRRVNEESGNDIWTIRGKIVAAPADVKLAQQKLNEQKKAVTKFLENGKKQSHR